MDQYSTNVLQRQGTWNAFRGLVHAALVCYDVDSRDASPPSAALHRTLQLSGFSSAFPASSYHRFHVGCEREHRVGVGLRVGCYERRGTDSIGG